MHYAIRSGGSCVMAHWVDRFVLASLKNCGTGSGGFEAGNNCASGGGALTETKDIGTRETTDAEAAGRGEAIAQHLGGLSGADFTKETARILTASGMSKEEAKVFAKSLDRSINHAVKTLTPIQGWDSPTAALEAAKGAACGYVAGIALYKELTGNGLDETTITAGSLTIGSSLNDIDRTLEESIAIYPEAKKSDYMGYFGLMVKEGKTVDSRPRIAINVLMTAAEENRRASLLAMNLPASRSLAAMSLGEGNFTIGNALVEMGTAPSDNANINGIAFSGDRESLRRMAKSGFGRTALTAMHTAVHELGHWQHYKAIEQTTRAANPDLTGVERWRATTKAWRARTITDAQSGWKSTAKAVSRYAQTSANEFVAEVYSGLAMGFRFNEDILREYAKLSGPATKRKAS